MESTNTKGKWIAIACIVLGLIVILYSSARLIRGAGGILALVVGLPILAYGILMFRAVRRIQ